MRRVLVLGLGISGKSATSYLLNQGYEVVGIDRNAKTLLQDPFFQKIKIFSEEEFSLPLESFDFIVKSPGLSWDHPLVTQAKNLKVPILSEIELALMHLQKKQKILFGITGSNGKTTTTLLTTHILNSCGKKAIALGNVGIPILENIDCDEKYLVIELSSFQIETLAISALDAGVILNVTPNHLDRYATFHDYATAKFQLQHCIKKEGKLFLQKKVFSDFQNLLDSQWKEKVATFSSLKYRDEQFPFTAHDKENCEAAFALCNFVGVSEEEFWNGLLTFQKPPHRIEFVRLLDGVNYINDSKATSEDAVIKAVESIPGQVILIAGGVDKGGNYEKWGSVFRDKTKKVLLIGQAAPKIRDAIPSLNVSCFETLNQAIEHAHAFAKKGDTILFSPGCSSFDQFRNYEHRGEVFKQLVHQLR